MKTLSKLCCAVLCMIAFSSCGDDSVMIFDGYPLDMAVYVEDIDGMDLLDPDNPDNVLQEIELSVDGEDVAISMQSDEVPVSRHIPATWNGAKIESGTKGHFIYIGEWERFGRYVVDIDLSIRGAEYKLKLVNNRVAGKKEIKGKIEYFAEGQDVVKLDEWGRFLVKI